MNRTEVRSRVGMIAMVVGMLAMAPVVWAAESGIVVDGSTTVGPIGDAFAEAFKAMHPEVAITVNKTGSGDGLRP